MQTQSAHKTHRNEGCQNVRQLFCYLNFFDPVHSDLLIRCSCTYFILEVEFPALKFTDKPLTHNENKFHQLDLTCHLTQHWKKSTGIDVFNDSLSLHCLYSLSFM